MTKNGDNLIIEEEKNDEARRRKEAKEAQALLNQKKIIAEAKMYEK